MNALRQPLFIVVSVIAIIAIATAATFYLQKGRQQAELRAQLDDAAGAQAALRDQFNALSASSGALEDLQADLDATRAEQQQAEQIEREQPAVDAIRAAGGRWTRLDGAVIAVDLTECPYTDEQCELLTSLEDLAELKIWGAKISDSGIGHLAGDGSAPLEAEINTLNSPRGLRKNRISQ